MMPTWSAPKDALIDEATHFGIPLDLMEIEDGEFTLWEDSFPALEAFWAICTQWVVSSAGGLVGTAFTSLCVRPIMPNLRTLGDSALNIAIVAAIAAKDGAGAARDEASGFSNNAEASAVTASAQAAEAGAQAAASATSASSAALSALAAGVPVCATIALVRAASADTEVFMVKTVPGIAVYQRDSSTTDTFLGWLGELIYDDVATLVAASDTGFETGQTIRSRKGGISYALADGAATDHHLTTAGGVKLHIADHVITLLHFGAIGDGVTDDTIPLQAFFDTVSDAKSGDTFDFSGIWGGTDTITIDQNSDLPLNYICGSINYIGVTDLDVLVHLADVRNSKFTEKFSAIGAGALYVG